MLKPTKQRLLERTVKHEGGCWICTYSPDSGGYPQIKVKGKAYKVSRISYALFVGPIPEKMFVCHSCDNRKCINPEHLWLGTHKENMDDMANKGRKITSVGDKNGARLHPDRLRKKLTKEQVIYIRMWAGEGFSNVKIAKSFFISDSHISRIVRGKFWKHVPMAATGICPAKPKSE